jgi:Ion channel
VYQCIALEASRAQHSRDKTEMKRRGLDVLTTQPNSPPNASTHSGEHSVADEIVSDHSTNIPTTVDTFFRVMDKARTFFRDTEIGRGISVTFPFAGLILTGALVVGPIEGWTFLEALYFAVVSLTTVGFGDYVPTELPSIIFCIFWLPFSVGFMSMYLGNVAAFYIRLSDRNIRRIERQLRWRLQRAKERAERERAEVLRRAYRGQEEQIEAMAAASDDGEDLAGKTSVSSGASSADAGAGVHHAIPLHHARRLARHRNRSMKGFDVLPTSDLGGRSDDEELFGSSDADVGNLRRQRIIDNSRIVPSNGGDGSQSAVGEQVSTHRTMKSMKDVIKAVRRRNNLDSSSSVSSTLGSSSQFMSIRSTQTMTQNTMFRSVQTRKPSFALRVLLQERFAEIIAEEIAGYQSSIEIKNNTLSVTIDSFEETADKWSIPRRARRAFRSVAFEVLYFVGEHGLVTRGADALYDLTPFEFHALFSSLVAAMGDADSMEQWLGSTDTLALVDLQRSQGDLLSSHRQGRLT